MVDHLAELDSAHRGRHGNDCVSHLVPVQSNDQATHHPVFGDNKLLLVREELHSNFLGVLALHARLARVRR